MFSHITLGIRDATRSRKFYDQVLGAPDIKCKFSGDDYAAYQAGDDPTMLWLLPPFDGKPAGVGNGSHIAFVAPSRAAVDEFYRLALAHGGSDEGPPGPRPQPRALLRRLCSRPRWQQDPGLLSPTGINVIGNSVEPAGSEVEQPLRIEGVALGLGLACFGAYQLFKLPVVLPVLLAQYDYDRTLAGAFMSVYAVSGLALSVWFGRIITRRGPLFLATPAVTCIGLGAALTLVAPQFGLVVLLSRGLEGIAFAVLGIIGPVLASSHATRRQLPLILGISAAWIPVGQLTATFLAPVSLTSIGWQGLWYVAIGGSAGLFLWCRRFSRRQTHTAERSAPVSKTAPFSRRQTLALLLSCFGRDNISPT